MPGLIKFGQVRSGHPVIGRRALEECPQRRVFRAPGGRLAFFSPDSCESEANVRREETRGRKLINSCEA